MTLCSKSNLKPTCCRDRWPVEKDMRSPDLLPVENAVDETKPTISQSKAPTIICFHGSGDNPFPGWEDFLSIAQQDFIIVLLDRGRQTVSLSDGNSILMDHLRERQIVPPYVLVAHSQGGAFAKWFLHREPESVAGMLLVETGQEGGLPPSIEEVLLRDCPLGNKPLSVIRGNSLIASWQALQMAEAATSTNEEQVRLRERRHILEAIDHEDDRLKKVQLQMSRTTRYVHLPGCGHNIVRDRPDVMLQELKWIVANLQPEENSANVRATIRR